MYIDITGKIIINHRSHRYVNGKKPWCLYPYPGHKNGCPMYFKRCQYYPDVERKYELKKQQFNRYFKKIWTAPANQEGE